MRKTIAIVFAGGRAPEMSVLTIRRPKSAVVVACAGSKTDLVIQSTRRIIVVSITTPSVVAA